MEMELCTEIGIHDRSCKSIFFHQTLQVCKQQQTASRQLKCACAYNLLMMGPLTMKLGALM